MIHQQMINTPIYEKLKEIARARNKITYGEIAPLANLDMDSPADRNTIAGILDNINQWEQQEGRPMLSAVVLLAEGNIPGEGFFTCANNLGQYAGGDKFQFWIAEINRVHDYWANR